MKDISNFYIKYKGHPKFQENRIIVDENLDTIIDKIEMILFTNKGEVFGDSNFGADIELNLWSSNISADKIKVEVMNQIKTYIPELSPSSYNVNFYIIKGELRDIGVVHVKLLGNEVKALFN
jgi:phage baseplate assembly protein W